METIKFKGDSATRKRFYQAASFQHPAKMHCGLFLECLERYTQPGDIVLDPMAGSGTALLGAMYGRTMILNELESHFCIPMLASWGKIQAHGPALGYTMGQAVILRGDARALPLPDASVGAAITSPPYEGSPVASSQGEITTSGGIGNQWRKQGMAKQGLTNLFGIRTGYTRPAAIVTSPPYEQSELPREEHDPTRADGIHPRYRYDGGQGENIGNQRGEAYWTSMRLVYAECWRVLRPGGILALVLKGFTRDGQYVDLPGQTEALLLAAGWEKHDHWRRELWSLSFWRTLQKRRDPAAFDERLMFEEVLAFRKPEGDGPGVAAVLTSPPYEGSLQGEPGIDWTRTMGGTRDRTQEDAFETVKAIHSGYTREAPDAQARP